ncbi:MAG: ArsB/NhaD family transporter [Candidatus Cloacimonetes bacterium]|nr:ArsB/NhaD family transporter [Candidatus Cloacimonadota bacterium]
MNLQMMIALGVFLICYFFIATEKINKIVIALTGAVFFMILGFVPQTKAFAHYIDWNVIFLLIGMMIMVGIIKITGLFEFIAIYLAKKAKGNPKMILLILFFITGIFSALLDNVTTVVILTPISILIAVEMGISPIPFVIAQAIASNIGGTATLIGDPPNLMIGSAAGISFLAFIKNLTIFVFFNMIVSAGIIYLFFRKKLVISNERRARIMEFQEKALITDKKLLIYAICVFVIFLLLLFFQEALHLHAATIALSAAVLLMLRTKKLNIDHFLNNEIEWGTIIFFIGLFIMVGALEETGIIKLFSKGILSLTDGNMKHTAISIVWTSGIASAFIDNIPFVATMIPMIKDIALTIEPQQVFPLWWALSLGACFGGNGTLIGASANLISASICKKSNYPISFMTFTKYGAIITFINLILATVFIIIKYF